MNNGTIKKSGVTKHVITYYLQNIGETSKLPALSERVDRRGNQSLKFTKVEIVDTDNQPMNRVISGQNILFRFHYTCKQARNDAEVCVSFVIREKEYPLTNINSIDSGQSHLELFSDGFFECLWPNFNLTANIYDCSLFCSINGEIADWVDLAFKIDVEDGDFFGSGKKIGFQSKFLVPHKWYSKVNEVVD